MPTQTTYLTVLKNAFDRFKAQWKHVLIGALLLGVCMALVGQQFEKLESRIRKIQITGDLSIEKMEEIGQRMEAGDQAAMEELLTQMESFTAKMDAMTEEQQEQFMQNTMLRMVKTFLPMFIFLITVTMIVSFYAMLYFLASAISEKNTILDNLQFAARKFFPFIGLTIWVILRSFAWVGLILYGVAGIFFHTMPHLYGIIAFAIYLFSVWLAARYWSASLYLVSGNGIAESAKKAFEETSQYVWRVLGYMILTVVIGIVCLMIVLIPFHFIPYGEFVAVLANQIFAAFISFFLVSLFVSLTGKKLTLK